MFQVTNFTVDWTEQHVNLLCVHFSERKRQKKIVENVCLSLHGNVTSVTKNTNCVVRFMFSYFFFVSTIA